MRYETCNTCRFLKNEVLGADEGYCWRYPPTVVFLGYHDEEATPENIRPWMKAGDSCGEHQGPKA